MQRSHKDQVRQSGESFLQTAHTEGVMVIFKVRKILPKTCLLFLIRYAASKAVCKRQLQRPSCLCHATLHSRTFLGAFGAAHDIHMCLRVFYTFFFYPQSERHVVASVGQRPPGLQSKGFP